MLITVRAKRQTKRLFIVLPNTSHTLLELQSGLLTALEAYSQAYGFFPYQFRIFTLEDDFKNGISGLFKHLTTETYDVILTVGTKCTQVVKTLSMKMRIATPIVFGGVLDLEQIFLTTGSLPFITGVQGADVNYSRQLEILLMLTQQVKKVLILQNRTITVGSEIHVPQQMIAFLEQRGIDAHEVIVDDMNALRSIVNPYLSGADLIIMLRRNIFMSHVRKIVELSFERGIPLYTCDLSSVDKGATLGFGDFDYKIGCEIVKKALPLLVKEGPSYSMSISTMPWEEKVIINTDVAKRQNFIINRQLAESIQSVSFI